MKTVSEHPILMCGEMVRATLENRKTQTRRVVKPPPFMCVTSSRAQIFGRTAQWRAVNTELPESIAWQHGGPIHDEAVSPYGRPGDRLWVRETFAKSPCAQGEPCFDCQNCRDGRVFRADDPDREMKWKPSIFMPRWASRLTLEVVSIRVERVQDISEADARAEGCLAEEETPYDYWEGYDTRIQDRYGNILHSMIPKECFPSAPPEWMTETKTHKGSRGFNIRASKNYNTLWNSINLSPSPIYAKSKTGKKQIVRYECFPWSNADFDARYPGVRGAGEFRGQPLCVTENPWVWVIEFKRILVSSQ